MLLDLFGKITYYLLTPAKRMTAHFYEHFLIPKTEENRSCEEHKYGFAGGFRLFPSSKSETHGYEKGLSLKESLVFEKGILFMDMDLFL